MPPNDNSNLIIMKSKLLSYACMVAVCTSSVAACSLLFSTKEQCSSDSECQAKGGAFAQSSCVANACVTDRLPPDGGDADDGGPYACANLPPAQLNTAERVTVSINYLDLNTATAVTQLDARLCASTDLLCSNPRPFLAPDGGVGTGSGLDGGLVGGWRPASSAGQFAAVVEYGFEGYFETRSASYGSALRFTSPSLRKSTDFLQVLLNPATTQALAEATLGGRPEAYDGKNRGLIFVLLRDCDQKALAGVKVTTSAVAAAAPAVTGFYILNKAASATARATDSDGQAGFLNVPPGVHTFTAEFADTGKRIGSVTATVRAGVTTTINLLPSR
jgi:hypothetical protein